MEHLIVKLFTNSISEKERDELLIWLQKEENISNLQNYIQNDYDLNRVLIKPDIDKAFESLLMQIDSLEVKDKQSNEMPIIPIFRKSWFKYVAAACVAIILFAGYYFVKLTDPIKFEESIVNVPIEPGTSKAILTLNDGTELILEKGKNYEDEYLNSNGEEIDYLKTNKAQAEKIYNYLTIPRGGQFFLKLSDGTKVWLNSDTKIKYPVHFVDGETRKVELVYGEAYFDVSPSTENKGSSFVLIQDRQNIKVLGTEFNIKAYKEDDKVYTTLVEGKVEVSNDYAATILKPNQQSVITGTTKNIVVSNVKVYSEIAWKDGIFNFREKELQEFVQVLMRWYDVDIIIEDPALKTYKFNGLLRKNQDLYDILKLINQTEQINYEKKNEKIILKK